MGCAQSATNAARCGTALKMTASSTDAPGEVHVTEPGGGGIDDEVFADVLVAAQANAPWAFERLYAEFAAAVAGYLRLRGEPDAEGLTNEVMLGVFRGLPEFEGDRDGFRSWVFTIAHHRLVDERRRRSARPKTSELASDLPERSGGDVEQEAFSRLGDQQVEMLLRGLTVDQREVVLLRVVADLSVDEVARILGKRPGAVKMLQRRGLDAMRRLLLSESVTP